MYRSVLIRQKTNTCISTTTWIGFGYQIPLAVINLLEGYVPIFVVQSTLKLVLLSMIITNSSSGFFLIENNY
jgi:hypothetical protein